MMTKNHHIPPPQPRRTATHDPGRQMRRPCAPDFTLGHDTADTQLQNNINRWHDPAVGRWLSVDPIGFEGGDANLYGYVQNKITNYRDSMGLLTSNTFKPGMKLYSNKGNFSFLFWGVAFNLEESDFDAIKEQSPLNATEDGHSIGGLISYNKIDVNFATCKSGKEYHFEREGWFYTPIKIDHAGQLMATGTGTHNAGSMQFDNDRMVASYLLFTFDPESLSELKKFQHYSYERRNPEKYWEARKECNEIQNSKGTIVIAVSAKLFAGNVSQGFQRNPNLANPGTSKFGQSMMDYNHRGRYSQTQPAAWNQTPISQTQGTVRISFDCCSGACIFSIEGSSISLGANRKSEDGRVPNIEGSDVQIFVPGNVHGPWQKPSKF